MSESPGPIRYGMRHFHLCVSDMASGPRDECPDPLHDYPLPAGYGDASEAAERRLRKRWSNVRCGRCGLYGWQPGDPTGDACDQRVPVPAEIIHLCPPGAGGLTPCCGKTPFELPPADRITADPALATCRPEGTAS